MNRLTHRVLRRTTWLLLAHATAFAGELPPLTEPDPGAVDAVFTDWDRTDRPGCSLGVYRDGEILYARGYGMANLEHDLANTSDTVFRIGSTSKQFTATAIALLAQEGKLDLDGDIHDIFPELPDYGAPVTIRHLLHHTSGIRDYLTLAWVADWSEDYTIEEALRLVLAQRELNFPPGSQYLYSNSNYFLMSQIVERVTGETLHAWAATHVFEPLGMEHTHFHDDHNHIVRHRADGYSPLDAGGYRIDMTILDMVGDGGIFTTVEDLARWNAHFVDNPLPGGAGLVEEMETPGTLTDGSSTGYGFGLVVGEHRGLRMISHGGAFVGFRAAMDRFPDQHLSVAVLCNVSTAAPWELSRRVADLYLADSLEPEPEMEAAPAEDRSALVTVDEAALERLTGHYWSADEALVREVALTDGRLEYVRSAESRNPLEPLGGDRFRMLGVPFPVIVRFEGEGATPARLLLEYPEEEPSVLDRYEPAQPSPDDLALLAGDWFSEELDATRSISLRDGRLVLEGRHEDAVLQPVIEDVFAADGLVLRFQRDDREAATGLLVDAGRVRDLRFTRR
ncbi:MAG: serine hydrolase domain-containing protein [Thermoanaerobaculia bacterium]